MQAKRTKSKDGESRGFSLLEVLISMTISVIVLAAVFGLLSQSQRSFEREPRVADLNQSARMMLETASADIMRAGAGLPPEFPSFTPKSVDSSVGNGGKEVPDVIEIVGAPENATKESVDQFDGMVATMDLLQTNLDEGDLVLVYNDDPRISLWRMAWVTAIDETNGSPKLTLNSRYEGTTVSSAYTHDLDPVGKPRYPWRNAFIARVSVIRYQADRQGPDLVLVRGIDFETPTPLGTIDDFQISYRVGNAPAVEQDNPPHPHPMDGIFLNPTDIISGVRITVASFSNESGEPIRKSLSTSAYPRAIGDGLAKRTRRHR